MRPIVTDRIAWSVCRSVTVVSPAKTAWPRCCLGWGLGWAQGPMYQMAVQTAPWQKAIFRRKDMPRHARWYPAVSCAKMAEPIEMLFGLWTHVSPRKHILGGVHTGATWRTPLNRSCAVVKWPFCQITLTTYYYYLDNSNKYMALI